MTNERLVELKHIVEEDYSICDRDYEYINKDGEDIISLIGAEIDRNKPTSDEVPEQLLNMFHLSIEDVVLNNWFDHHISRSDCEIIYKALQAYGKDINAPSKEPCEWCGLGELYGHNFCKDCGRDLKGELHGQM